MKSKLNTKKTPSRIKMMFAIIVAFGIVVTIAPTVFLANTPEINPQFIADIGLLPEKMMAYIRNPLSPKNAQDEFHTAQIGKSEVPTSDLNYTPITTGVYAAEDPATGEQYVKIVKGTQVKKTPVQLDDGRVVDVYIPVVNAGN